jgi:type I restriction enzyme M protein
VLSAAPPRTAGSGEKQQFAADWAGATQLIADDFAKRSSRPALDIAGLCRIATTAEIEAQGWSLNPGRYVGSEVEDLDDEVFEEKLAAAHAELRELAARAGQLEASVDSVLSQLLAR